MIFFGLNNHRTVNTLLLGVSIVFFSITPLLSQSSLELLKEGERLNFNNPDSAIIVYNALQLYAEERSQLDTLALAKNRLASLYYMKGDYMKSLEGFKEAFQIASEVNNLTQIAASENGVGLVNLGQLQYESAIVAFKKAHQLNTELGNYDRAHFNLFNIGICLRELGRYEESIEYLDQVIEHFEKPVKGYGYVMAINQKAKTLFNMDDFEASFSYYQEAISYEEITTNWERTFAYSGLAENYYQKKDYQNALKYALQGKKIAQELNALWDEHRASKIVWKSYDQLNRYQEALQESKNFIQLADSLFHLEKDRQINRVQSELTDVKTKLLESNLAIAQNKLTYTNYLVLAISVIVILLLFFIFYYRRDLKKKAILNAELNIKNQDIEEKRRLLEESNQTKNRIFSIISHDLRAPLTSMSQIMDMEKSDLLTEKEISEMRDVLRSQVTKTRSMMDELLDWANKQLDGISSNPSKIKLERFIDSQLTKNEFALKAKKLSPIIKINPKVEVHADKDHLGIIFQNILSNAVKFSPIDSKIEITVDIENEQAFLKVRDFGVGINQKTLSQIQSSSGKVDSSVGTLNEKGHGIGLLLASQLMLINNIKMNIESTPSQGSTFTLYFSKPKQK